MNDCTVAAVAVWDVIYSIDKLYHYYIPEDLENTAVAGTRVIIPFGVSNKQRNGIILSIMNDYEYKKLKYIISVVHNQTILNDEFLKLSTYIKQQCFCTYSEAIRIMLPTGYNIDITEIYKINTNISVDLTEGLTPLMNEILTFIKTAKQIKKEVIWDFFGDEGIREASKLVKMGYL